MKKNKKRLYVAADLGWRAAIFCGELAVILGIGALIPGLVLDISEKRSRNRARNNKK